MFGWPCFPGPARLQLQYSERGLSHINPGYDSQCLYKYLVRGFRLYHFHEAEIKELQIFRQSGTACCRKNEEIMYQ
jgi:hypothetical protein